MSTNGVIFRLVGHCMHSLVGFILVFFKVMARSISRSDEKHQLAFALGVT